MEKKLCIRLKEIRERKGLSIKKCAEISGIALNHIQALENCDYDKLPTSSAHKTIVKQYARACGIDEIELEDAMHELDHKPHNTKTPTQKRISISFPNIIRTLLATGAVFSIALYLGMEVHAMIGPPALNIIDPTENFETAQNVVRISGSTEPESTVTLNGLKTNLDTEGNFEEQIHLKRGLNEIMIESISKRGGRASATRSVLYMPEDTRSASENIEATQL